jgi:hypothetical protein
MKENKYFPPLPPTSPPGSPVTTPTQRVDWKWSRAGDKVGGSGGIQGIRIWIKIIKEKIKRNTGTMGIKNKKEKRYKE